MSKRKPISSQPGIDRYFCKSGRTESPVDEGEKIAGDDDRQTPAIATTRNSERFSVKFMVKSLVEKLLFYYKIARQNAQNSISDLLDFENFMGGHAPRPHLEAHACGTRFSCRLLLYLSCLLQNLLRTLTSLATRFWTCESYKTVMLPIASGPCPLPASRLQISRLGGKFISWRKLIV